MITQTTFNGSRFTTHALASFSDVAAQATNFAAFNKAFRVVFVTPASVHMVSTKFGKTAHVIFTAE